MALFVLPWAYIPDPTQDRPVFNGKLYFGVADQDPVLFPKDVTLIQEDGTSIVAEQPIRTNSGGTPTYNGSPVAIDLTGDYSLRVLDRNDQQIYEYPSLVATDDNLTANALRAAALRLNLDADEIGTTLITNAEGQSLDSAEYLLDTNSGLLYSLPDDIPAGSTVVSSSGTTLVTSNGQFEMNPVWHYAVNRLIGNQIPVVEGSTGDPLPDATPTAYAINSEPAAGYEFVTAATNVTFDAGLWKGTGQLQRKYKRDAAGFISKTSEYAGVRLHDDTQLRALVDDIATNGCSVTDDADYVYVTFELSDFPNGVKFPFIAAEVGVIAEIGGSDGDGLIPIGWDQRWTDVSSSRSAGITYTNASGRPIMVSIVITIGTSSGVTLVDGLPITRVSLNSGMTQVFIVPPGVTYSFPSGTGSSIAGWYELRG